MLKSIRIEPNPQPPAAASAWMMPSDAGLFGSVETSVFHGFGASKSPPGMVVEDVVVDGVVVDGVVVVELVVVELVVVELVVVALVVVGLVVVELVVVDGLVVVELLVVELVVALVVVELVDELEDVVVVGTRVDDVVVDEVAVVVVFFFRPSVVVDVSLLQMHVVHTWPARQSALVSHCSPAAVSSRPSPHVDGFASKRRRFAPRAVNVPVRRPHDMRSTFARSRAPRSPPQSVQRARTVLRAPRRPTRATTPGHPLAIVSVPSASSTTASAVSSLPGTSAGVTRKRTPGHGVDGAACAAAGAAMSAMASSASQRAAVVEVSTSVARASLAARGPGRMARERSIGGGRRCKRRTPGIRPGARFLAMCHGVEDRRKPEGTVHYLAVSC